MPSTIFLTGGTGFIGSHFINQATDAGHTVIALRRKDSRSAAITLPNLVWIEAPMADVPLGIFSRCNVLIHMAAVGVTPQRASWNELFQGNVVDSLALWTRAADEGIKRFVVCGSCAEYGRIGERYAEIPAEAPLEPAGMYAASKAAASMAALAFANERSVELILLRPFHVFGEGQHPENFWPSLQAAAFAGRDFEMTKGEQVRDYVSVERVAASFLDAVTRPDLVAGQPKIENVGTGFPQTLHEFAAAWWSRWAARGKLLVGALPYRANEVMRYVPAVNPAPPL